MKKRVLSLVLAAGMTAMYPIGALADEIAIDEVASEVTEGAFAPEGPRDEGDVSLTETVGEAAAETEGAAYSEEVFAGETGETPVQDEIKWAIDEAGVLTVSGKGAMTDCSWKAEAPKIKKAVIGEGITNICDTAFYGCSRMTEVSIPSTVTEIGAGAFSWCSSLENVVMPNSVTKVGALAFAWCSSFTDIILSNSLTEIATNTFWCSSVTTIVVPSSVKAISDGAFFNCPNLVDVYYSGIEEQWKKISVGTRNVSLSKADVHYSTAPARAEANASVVTEGSAHVFTVDPVNVEHGSIVMLALYKDMELRGFTKAEYTGEKLVFKTDIEYDNAKVIIWSNVYELTPVVKTEEFAQ